MTAFLILLIYLLSPAVIIFLCQRIAVLDKLGVVVIAFVSGIALSATHLIPASQELRELQTTISEASVALALPLLVFSINIAVAIKLSGNTIKGLILAIFSVVSVSCIAAVLFAPRISLIEQVAAMSVGAYTGGGPNMAAIKTAINANPDLFTTMITYDILLSALYILFAITIAKPIFSLLLPAFKKGNKINQSDHFDHLANESAQAYNSLISLNKLPKTLIALLFSAMIVGGSVAFSAIAPGEMSSAIAVIAITSLGIAASFVPKIRALPNSYQLGMYLILVFCFTTGTMTDTSIIKNLNFNLFAYIGTLLIASIIMHAALCRLFKIDVDTFIITSGAAIMSVPFIPVIAGALKNRALLLPGFAAAILGYILGNYLGVAVYWGLKSYLLG